MLRKSMVILCVLALAFFCCACGKTNAKVSETPAKDIVSANDIVSIWRIEMPWPVNEAREFGESLGVSNFATTAKMVTYIELLADGTATYLRDFDLQMDAAKSCYFTIFYEAYTAAKKVLDENAFLKLVEDSYGYQAYLHFLAKDIPERFQDSPSHIAFFELAYDEMCKYENAPIEEQAAVGSLWSEMLEEIGSGFQYVDGQWVGKETYFFPWSYEDSILTIDSSAYPLDGNTQTFTVTSPSGSIQTWIRMESPA